MKRVVCGNESKTMRYGQRNHPSTRTKATPNELVGKEDENGRENCKEGEWNHLEDNTISFSNGVNKQSGVERALSRS